MEGVPSVAAAEVMTSEEQANVRYNTSVLRQGNEDLLQAEVESLRRSVAAQEDRISQLTKQLQVSQENERKLTADLEAARGDAGRLMEDLRLERLVREQAEAAATELRVAAEMATQSVNMQEKMARQNQATRSSASPGRRAPNTDLSPGRVRGKDAGPTPPQPNTPLATPVGASGGSGLPSGRRGNASQRAPQPPSAKDEIDGRLHEFLERSDCGLLFRRLNRGWYAFRRKDERGPTSNDRSLEISIVNGKLMAKLEPSTHDSGWNNGKLGTIERFCASMSV